MIQYTEDQNKIVSMMEFAGGKLNRHNQYNISTLIITIYLLNIFFVITIVTELIILRLTIISCTTLKVKII